MLGLHGGDHHVAAHAAQAGLPHPRPFVGVSHDCLRPLLFGELVAQQKTARRHIQYNGRTVVLVYSLSYLCSVVIFRQIFPERRCC